MTASAAAPQRVAASESATDGAFSPARMMEIELTEPLPAVPYDGKRSRVWVLGRLHTEPVGALILRVGTEGLTPDQLGALLWPELRDTVTARFAAAGLPGPRELTGEGLKATPAEWPLLRHRRDVMAAAPFISVVICTRDGADRLETCLRGLDRQEYQRFEVIVVDNAPTSDAVRTLVELRERGAACHYVLEAQGGLSRARNAGASAANGEIIAFLDDDEEPDRHWLAGLAGGFARGDDIGCVTGMILPARLDTPAEELFEQSGGHSKGRGFAAAIFSADGPQNPLYPLPPFGAGGNMAFRREALARIGGFDTALGAGTPARGGEDTLALTLTLLSGYRIAYEPTAFVRHAHYADLDGLGSQLYGYGVGLTAYYMALLRRLPTVFPALLRLLPAAVGYLRGASTARRASVSGLPPELKRQQRSGILIGPAAYIRSVCSLSQVHTVDRRAGVVVDDQPSGPGRDRAQQSRVAVRGAEVVDVGGHAAAEHDVRAAVSEGGEPRLHLRHIGLVHPCRALLRVGRYHLQVVGVVVGRLERGKVVGRQHDQRAGRGMAIQPLAGRQLRGGEGVDTDRPIQTLQPCGQRQRADAGRGQPAPSAPRRSARPPAISNAHHGAEKR